MNFRPGGWSRGTPLVRTVPHYPITRVPPHHGTTVPVHSRCTDHGVTRSLVVHQAPFVIKDTARVNVHAQRGIKKHENSLKSVFITKIRVYSLRSQTPVLSKSVFLFKFHEK